MKNLLYWSKSYFFGQNFATQLLLHAVKILYLALLLFFFLVWPWPDPDHALTSFGTNYADVGLVMSS
jgi:hypothetical protein